MNRKEMADQISNVIDDCLELRRHFLGLVAASDPVEVIASVEKTVQEIRSAMRASAADTIETRAITCDLDDDRACPATARGA